MEHLTIFQLYSFILTERFLFAEPRKSKMLVPHSINTRAMYMDMLQLENNVIRLVDLCLEFKIRLLCEFYTEFRNIYIFFMYEDIVFA